MGAIFRKQEVYCASCDGRRLTRIARTADREACEAAGHTIETRPSSVWWVSYRRNGKRFDESSRSPLKGTAKKLLQQREGAIDDGKPITSAIGRFTFEQAAADLLNHYRTNNKRSLVVVERRVRKHLTPFFAGRRMADLSTATVRASVAHRQQQGVVAVKGKRTGERVKDVSNAEINRELSLLKRMFSLAIQAGVLFHKPHIPLLEERNTRTGFFEPAQLAAVLEHLPPEIRPAVQFASVTGWRVADEVLPLEWRQVDFAAGEVVLDVHSTKNGEARTFPLTADLRTLLQTQYAEHERLQKAEHLVPYVFFREVADGRGGEKKPRPIRSFTKVGKPRAARRAVLAGTRTISAGPRSGASSGKASPSASR